jgi:hypothetical protein
VVRDPRFKIQDLKNLIPDPGGKKHWIPDLQHCPTEHIQKRIAESLIQNSKLLLEIEFYEADCSLINTKALKS